MIMRVLLIDVGYGYKRKFKKYLAERGKSIKIDAAVSFNRFNFYGGTGLTEIFERNNFDLYLVSHLERTYNKNIIKEALEYGCNIKQLGHDELTPDEEGYSRLLKIIEGDAWEDFWESTNL